MAALARDGGEGGSAIEREVESMRGSGRTLEEEHGQIEDDEALVTPQNSSVDSGVKLRE